MYGKLAQTVTMRQSPEMAYFGAHNSHRRVCVYRTQSESGLKVH